MDDEHVERELRRYRPAQPPTDLRERAIRAALCGRARWLEWIPVAATIAAAALLYSLANGERRSLAGRIAYEPREVQTMMSAITDAIGREPSREEIEWWLEQQAYDHSISGEPVQ